MSRNALFLDSVHCIHVAPREGRVSRNEFTGGAFIGQPGRAPRGACE